MPFSFYQQKKSFIVSIRVEWKSNKSWKPFYQRIVEYNAHILNVSTSILPLQTRDRRWPNFRIFRLCVEQTKEQIFCKISSFRSRIWCEPTYQQRNINESPSVKRKKYFCTEKMHESFFCIFVPYICFEIF